MSFVLALHAGWPIEIVYWGTLFHRVFPRSFFPSFACSFSIFSRTSGWSRFLLGHVSILFLSRVCGPFPGKQRLWEKAKTANHSPIGETMATRIWEGRTFVVGFSWDRYNHNDVFRYNISRTLLPSGDFFLAVIFFIMVEIDFYITRECNLTNWSLYTRYCGRERYAGS